MAECFTMRIDTVKILIVGLSDKVGGIETLFYGLFGKRQAGFDVSFLCFGKECAFQKEFQKNGCTFYFVPPRRESLLAFNKNIKKFYKEHNDFDYIWFNTSSTSIYQIQFFGKKYTNAKIITHSHGTKFEKNAGLIRHLCNLILDRINHRKAISSTDLFFCCSYKAGISLFGKNKSKELVLIKNGIDIEKFKFDLMSRSQIRSEFNIDNNSPVIGLIGRLSSQKNVIRAVDIFTCYLRQVPNAILLIAGTGELEKEMVKRINRNGIFSNVRFAGFRTDVHKFYSAIDVLLMPSLFEGLPLSGIEAQTSGASCLFSSEITNEAKILDNSEFLNLKKSNDKWAAALKELSDNLLRIDERVEAFKKVIAFDYTNEATISKLRRIFNVIQ